MQFLCRVARSAGDSSARKCSSIEHSSVGQPKLLVSQLPLCLELFHDLQEGVIDMLVVGKPILDLPQI